MRNITISALAALLAGTDSVMSVELLTNTNARLRKNPWGAVRKEARVIGKIGATYQWEVNKALMKSLRLPTFSAKPLPWGKRVGDSAVIMHAAKGTTVEKPYVQVIVLKSPFPRFLDENVTLLARKLLRRFMPEPYFSKRQAAKGLKTEEKQVCLVTYALESIKEIILDGTHYVVTAA